MNPKLVALCIFFYGLSTFCRKLAVDRLHPYQLQVISGFMYFALIPLFFQLGKKSGVEPYNAGGVFYMVLCILSYLIAAIAFGYLLKDTQSVGVVTALVSLSPAITLMFSMLFLGETFSFWKAVAFVLALISAILVNF